MCVPNDKEKKIRMPTIHQNNHHRYEIVAVSNSFKLSIFYRGCYYSVVMMLHDTMFGNQIINTWTKTIYSLSITLVIHSVAYQHTKPVILLIYYYSTCAAALR